MAFQKPIPLQNGIVPQYWRVIGVFIDATAPTAGFVLGGYVSAEIRTAGGGHVDQREYALGAAQFGALAASPAVGPTTFAAIATPCYEFARTARRPADSYDPETGIATLGGVEYSGDAVVNLGTEENPQWTVPSEFADAVNV